MKGEGGERRGRGVEEEYERSGRGRPRKLGGGGHLAVGREYGRNIKERKGIA